MITAWKVRLARVACLWIQHTHTKDGLVIRTTALVLSFFVNAGVRDARACWHQLEAPRACVQYMVYRNLAAHFITTTWPAGVAGVGFAGAWLHEQRWQQTRVKVQRKSQVATTCRRCPRTSLVNLRTHDDRDARCQRCHTRALHQQAPACDGQRHIYLRARRHE